MSYFLLPLLVLSWQTHCQQLLDLQARSIGRLYQYEDIAREQGFGNLEPCAADCLFKPCHGNSTCEATKHSVDFELGCIASTCICDSARFLTDAEAYIQTCVLKYCNGNQTLASAAHDVLKTFCSNGDTSTINHTTISHTTTSHNTTIIGPPPCNTDTVFGSISTQNGSFIPAFPSTMPGCTSLWSPPKPTETTKPPKSSPRGLTSTGRTTLYAAWLFVGSSTILSVGFIWYLSSTANGS